MEKNKKGFIRLIVLIIVAIIILSYLNFDLKKLFTTPTTVNNFSYVWTFIKNVWNNYLSVPFTFLWSEALKPLMNILWKAFKAGIENIQAVSNQ